MKTSLSLILATIIFGYSLSVSAAPVCNQTFEGTLRVGLGYTFGDMYTNTDGFRHNIAGGNVTIDESSAGDLNRAGGPGFTWTQQLLAQDYEIAPGQTIQALSADTPYYVYDYPISRDNKLLVIYSLDVQAQNDDGSWTRPPITHNECKSYTVTRCGDGVVDPGYETCDPAAPGQSPTSCDVATCQPIVQQPTCDSITVTPTTGNIPVTSSVSCTTSNETSVAIDCGNGLPAIAGKAASCTYTTVGTFAPRCIVNGSITGPACTASVTTTPAVPAPYISIKKYVKTLNAAGDTQSAPVSVARGEAFNYYYQLQNTGSVAATGVVVKDTLPAYLTHSGAIIVTSPTGTDVSADWTCTKGSQIFPGETLTRITLVCSKLTPLPANSGLYTFTIPVVLSTTAPVAINMQNVVYACAANQVSNPTGPNGEIICDDIKPPPPPPPAQCDKTNPNSQKDPACIVVTGTGFDLSLKKYIGINDAQVGSPLSVSNGAVLNYIIRVTNSGPESSSGVTTVQDRLPTGVVLDGTASGSSWSCTLSGVTIACTSSLVVASGSAYPDITVPFRVTATAGQTVTNIAAVDNPNEVNRCMADGSMPATDSAYCTRDTNNSDPAVLTVPVIGGGSSNIGKKCVNGIATCANYNTLAACIADGIPAALCYPADAVGQKMCSDQSLSCSGPGGGGGGGGGGSSGRCGDGVLQPNLGEECDVVGAPWCDASCKVKLDTNPGANPITSMWMRIPALGGSRHLGTAGYIDMPLDFDGSTSDSYKIVVGRDTNVFTLADQLIFGVTTQYQIPIIIPADKKMCLQANGAALNSPDGFCTTFGAVAPQTTINGAQYVVLGGGTYQQKIGNTNTYEPKTIRNPVHEALLFKGSTQYVPLGESNIGPTLRDAFKGAGVVSDNGSISLFGCSGSDCSPTAITTMIQIPVRVSGAVVSSIGSASNRALESFLGTVSPFAGFLGTTNMNTSTTSNNTNTTTTVTVPTLVGKTGGSVSTIAELESYAVNGNKNILAVTGDLTITCPAGSTVFTMTGVRTVIVSGNLIIRCNIVYGSSDSTSSWAWIAKNGNIQVSNGTGPLSVGAVTNLAGVYVAVKETTGGDITYIGNNTTQAILRIEGTLYGNASPLFGSRLYARATGAYDILTTGTILTYSNRALVSPPPLLSQYLGTYQVQRVVQ